MFKEVISIIVLSYKNLEYINETLDSILMQTYENIEIIIGDDSTDNFNIDYYRKYLDENKGSNIKNVKIYTNENNLGIVKNANKAISLCSGKYIKFIAADDCFYDKDVISKMIKYMSENNSLILTTHILKCDIDMIKMNDAEESINRSRHNLKMGNNPQEFFKYMSKGCCIPAPGTMLHKNLFEEYDLFDEEYCLIEDWCTWLKLSRQGVKFDYLDIISVKYRVGVGVSTSKTSNPLLIKDKIKCIENEILPYKKELGFWLHRYLKCSFIYSYKLKNYSFIRKLLFLLSYIDIISFVLLRRLKRKIFNNENK